MANRRRTTCWVDFILLAAVARMLTPSGPLAAADASTPKEPILVFAAASTSDAINELKGRFANQSGVTVQTSYAASSTLAQQIVHGAEADLFLSADTAWVDELVKKDFVTRQHELLGNRLVIVVAAGSTLHLEKPEDLLRPGYEHLALGEPQSVPAGRYAKRALAQLGLWSKLQERIVTAADVRQALAYVEAGAAEVGIVYATDAAISKKVTVAAEIPEKLSGPIRYPLALLKHGQTSEAAQAFYRYLGSAEAAPVFRKYGFTLLAPGKADAERVGH